VIDIINELSSFGVELFVHDPIADKDEAIKEYDIELVDWEDIIDMDAIVLAVAHQHYRDMSAEQYAQILDLNRLIIDVKSVLDKEAFSQVDIRVWRL
jgi:UDP-N-acetyl-D-galactosamine dehydrogenase